MTNNETINFDALLVSTILSFLSVHSKIIEKPLFKWLGKETQQEQDLSLKKSSLINEQNAINIVDEFARYSKLQRQINRIDEELKEIKANKPTQNYLIQFGFGYGVKFVLTLTLLILSIYYRNTPVFQMDESINLMPFTHIACYPNGINQISFYFWAMCTAAAARTLLLF